MNCERVCTPPTALRGCPGTCTTPALTSVRLLFTLGGNRAWPSHRLPSGVLDPNGAPDPRLNGSTLRICSQAHPQPAARPVPFRSPVTAAWPCSRSTYAARRVAQARPASRRAVRFSQAADLFRGRLQQDSAAAHSTVPVDPDGRTGLTVRGVPLYPRGKSAPFPCHSIKAHSLDLQALRFCVAA